MNIKKIVLAGGGVIGSQIAFQCAYCGYNVTVWLMNDECLNQCKDNIERVRKTYLKDLAKMDTPEGKSKAYWCYGLSDKQSFDYETCVKKVEEGYKRITLVTDLKSALAGADVVIEAIAESIEIKKNFYKTIAPLLDEKTIVLTNSSTLLPSMFAEDTGRKEMFCSFHFANVIHRTNIVEVMRHEYTSDETFDIACKLGESIKMNVSKIYKEKNGYVLNSLVIPFLLSALDMVANGISDPKDIDKSWRVGSNSPLGPFQMIDYIGVNTIYNIIYNFKDTPESVRNYNMTIMLPYNYDGMLKLLKKMIEENRLGISTGHGFYDYK